MATAQQTYPDRPVRIIVTQAAGSGIDIQARALATKLGPILGQSVVVENRPGANGILGMDAAAKARPDGYTLVFTTASVLTMNPFIYKKLPYDSLQDFIPLAQFGVSNLGLVVNSAVPVRSVRELVAYSKAHPGVLNYGSFGKGNGTHLLGELMASSAEIDIRHVPYKGQTPALTDLIGGQVSMLFTTLIGTTEHIKSGRLRLLATCGDERDPGFPDVPTMKEAGYPGVTMLGWSGLFALTGTSAPIVTRLQAASHDVIASPDFREALAKQGTFVVKKSPSEFSEYIRTEAVKWQAVIRAAGLERSE